MKHNQHLNPKEEGALRRGIEGLRTETVDESGVSATATKMMATGKARASRPVVYRLVVVGGAAAALSVVAFWPRTSSAASLKDVVKAVSQMSARYERVYKPSKDGKLELYMEQWGEPGKYAMRFVGNGEHRYNGQVVYGYWPKTNRQRVIEAEAMEIDPVGVEAFSQFKLLRVEDEGATLRYVYNIRQDLIIDKKTKLPTQRVVHNSDDSIMEVHEYHFTNDLEDSIFEPDVKPGVPFFNIPEDRQKLKGMLAMTPQSKVVAGVKINLHAVVIGDDGMVSAILTGEAPRASHGKELLQVMGYESGKWSMNAANYTTYAGKYPQTDNTLRVGNQTAILEKAHFPTKPQFGGKLALRVPVWKMDPSLPLLDWDTKKKIGIDSKFVGWAEFTVTNPLYTEQVEEVLPNWMRPPSVGKAKGL